MARRTLGDPGLEQRRQGGPLSLRATLAGLREDPDLDVEVADLPELGAEDLQLADVVAHDRALERVTEDPPAGTDATAGHAHGVDLFRVLAGDRARDASEHPRHVEAQDLPPGLGPGVAGRDLRAARER